MKRREWISLEDRLKWARARMEPPPTVIAIAEACELKRAAVYLWLNGTTKQLEPETYRAAAKFFGVNRDWLETGEGDPLGEASTQPPAARPTDKRTEQIVTLFVALSEPKKQLAIALLKTVQSITLSDSPGAPKRERSALVGGEVVPAKGVVDGQRVEPEVQAKHRGGKRA